MQSLWNGRKCFQKQMKGNGINSLDTQINDRENAKSQLMQIHQYKLMVKILEAQLDNAISQDKQLETVVLWYQILKKEFEHKQDKLKKGRCSEIQSLHFCTAKEDQ